MTCMKLLKIKFQIAYLCNCQITPKYSSTSFLIFEQSSRSFRNLEAAFICSRKVHLKENTKKSLSKFDRVNNPVEKDYFLDLKKCIHMYLHKCK